MKKPEELFKEHFDKFRSGLFKASLDHYLETGTLSGSMLLEVRAMFEAHDKQKLNIASVSGKRPTRKLFCKVWTQTFGEEIDNVNQLVYGQAALGEDLYELCLKFHKAASATEKGEERKE